MSRQRRRREAAAAPRAVRAHPGLRRPRGPLASLHARLHRIVRTKPVLIALALAALHVLLALLTFEPRPHTGGDNAAYITLGRSLLETGTYTELWDPLEPPHTKYPPVFPAILAVAMAIGLQPWVQLKLVVLALSAAAVAASYLWMRARGRPLLGAGVALLVAIAPGVLREGRWILSDVPFWTFTMLGLWAFERIRGDGDWKRFAPAALAMLLAYFTRSAGLPLVLAALSWLAWRRHWKQLGALVVIIGVPAILWWLRGKAYGPSGYVSEFWLIDPYEPALGRIGIGDLFTRMLENNTKYISTHLPILLGGGVSKVLQLASGLVFLLGLFGWIARVRRPRVAELFVPLYIGLIYVWPSNWSGERFLLPLMALLLFYAGEALVRLTRRISAGSGFAVAGGVLALLVLVTLPGLAVATQIGMECTQRYRDGEQFPCLPAQQTLEYFEMAPLAKSVLPDSAVVITRKPRLFFGLGGPQASMYPLGSDAAAFFAHADSVGAGYVVLDRLDALSQAYVVPVLEQHPRAFCLMLVSEETQTALFGLVRDTVFRSGAASDASAGFTLCGPEFWRSPEVYLQYTPPR